MFANQLNPTFPTTAQVNCAVTPAGLVPVSISWNGASNINVGSGAALLGYTNAPAVNAGFGFANSGIPANATITVPCNCLPGATHLSNLGAALPSNATIAVPLNTLQGALTSGWGGVNSGFNYGGAPNISGLAGCNLVVTPSGQIIAR